MRRRTSILVPLFALLAAAPLAAQQQQQPAQPRPAQPQQQAPVTRPAPDPADVASADAILAALYDVISGPAGQKRNWDRFLSLFSPGARLVPTGRRPDGSIGHRAMTPEQYIEGSSKLLEERGFFEREIGRTTQSFGPIMHVMSAYDSRWKAEDPEPFARGVNSIQLLNDGKRWWVVSVYWADENTAQAKIPAEYLKK